VHLRDALPGQINISIGRGQVDFPAAIDALTAAGYAGHYSLELETRDIDDADRPAEAGQAGRYITALLQAA
jgi:sugar phosphate isomerase/epimerase